MAKQPEYRYNPLDFEPDVAVGVLLPFNGNAPGRSRTQNYASGSMQGASVFALSYSTEEQAIANLKNLLLTRKGERFMQPDFGTRLFNSVFEPNTEELETIIEDGLNEDITEWLPYILLDNINVQRYIDEHSVDITISFRITEQGANQVIKLLVDNDGIQINEPVI
jgi:phage baseplate assembly protein W